MGQTMLRELMRCRYGWRRHRDGCQSNLKVQHGHQKNTGREILLIWRGIGTARCFFLSFCVSSHWVASKSDMVGGRGTRIEFNGRISTKLSSTRMCMLLW